MFISSKVRATELSRQSVFLQLSCRTFGKNALILPDSIDERFIIIHLSIYR